jgi:hypothetical protein
MQHPMPTTHSRTHTQNNKINKLIIIFDLPSVSSPSIYDTYRHHEYFYIFPIVFQVGLVLVVGPSWLLDDMVIR